MANSKQKQTPGEIYKKKKTNRPQIVYPGPQRGTRPVYKCFHIPQEVLTTIIRVMIFD